MIVIVKVLGRYGPVSFMVRFRFMITPGAPTLRRGPTA
jgi:hypothetical protein